jgi:hypothetical protein
MAKYCLAAAISGLVRVATQGEQIAGVAGHLDLGYNLLPANLMRQDFRGVPEVLCDAVAVFEASDLRPADQLLHVLPTGVAKLRREFPGGPVFVAIL